MRTLSNGQMLRFYIPLMLQTVSQCLTYPLVAMVTVRGPLGSDAMAAFAQGQTVMFILGTLGFGLVTTGMVFARGRQGFNHFFKLNLIIGAVIVGLQITASLPPFDRLIFGGILNMSGELYDAARETLLLCVPSHFFFVLRTPYQVALYNIRDSARANWASMGRVAATALLSYVWCKLFPNAGGIRAAVLVFSVPIILEVIVSRMFAIRTIRNLPESTESCSIREQFWFNLPLTLGGFLLSVSALIIAAFIGRTGNAEQMKAIHFMVIGIVNPLAFSGLRIQTVTLSFLTSHGAAFGGKILRFGALVGVVLCGVVLLLQIPALSQWYFGEVQLLPPESVKMAMFAALCLAPLPLLQAFRSHAEGVAAWQKRPRLILAGQIAFIAALFCSLVVMRELKTPGYLMGAIAISVAVIATQLTIRTGLLLPRKNM